MRRHGLTTLIFAGFVLGIVIGYLVNRFTGSETVYLQSHRPGPHFRHVTLRRLIQHFEHWPVDKITQTALDDYVAKHHAAFRAGDHHPSRHHANNCGSSGRSETRVVRPTGIRATAGS